MYFQTKWNSFCGCFDPVLKRDHFMQSCNGFGGKDTRSNRPSAFWATACHTGTMAAYWSHFQLVLTLSSLLIPLPCRPFFFFTVALLCSWVTIVITQMSCWLLLTCCASSKGFNRSKVNYIVPVNIILNAFINPWIPNICIYRYPKDIKCSVVGSLAVCTQQTVVVINCVNTVERKCVLLQVLKNGRSQMNVCSFLLGENWVVRIKLNQEAEWCRMEKFCAQSLQSRMVASPIHSSVPRVTVFCCSCIAAALGWCPDLQAMCENELKMNGDIWAALSCCERWSLTNLICLHKDTFNDAWWVSLSTSNRKTTDIDFTLVLRVWLILETTQRCCHFIQLSKPLCLLYYYICILESNKWTERIRKFTSDPL